MFLDEQAMFLPPTMPHTHFSLPYNLFHLQIAKHTPEDGNRPPSFLPLKNLKHIQIRLTSTK